MTVTIKCNPQELHIPAIIFRNEDHTIVFINADASALYGFSTDEFLHLNVTQLYFNPDQSQVIEDILYPATQSQHRKGHLHRTKSGNVIAVQIIGMPIEFNDEDCTMLIIDPMDSNINGNGPVPSSSQMQISMESQDKVKIETLFTDYRFLLNSSPDLIFRIRRDGTYLEVFPENSPRLAVPSEQVIGRNIREILPSHIAEIAMKSIKDCFERNTESRCEYSLELPSGRHYFESRNKPVNSQEAFSIIRDITEMKRTQEEMTIFQNRLQLAQEMALLGYWDYNHAEGVITLSDFLKSELGIEPGVKSLTLKSLSQLVHPDFVERLDEACQNHVKNHVPLRVEFKMKLKNGKETWFYVRALTNYNDSGVPILTSGIAQNITERMDLKFQFENQGTLFASMLNSIPDVLFYKNKEGRFLGVNKKFEELVGLKGSFIIGKTDYDLFDAENAKLFVANDQIVINSRQSIIRQEYLKLDNGKFHVFESLKGPIFNNDDEIIGIIGFSRIIDDRLELESEIQYHAEFLQVLLDLANGFINIPVKYVDQAINFALEKVGLFVGTDRSYIFSYDFRNNDCSNTYEWCAEGISPEIDNLQNVPLDAIPHWVDSHMKNKPMIIEDVFALSPEDGIRQILEPQGVKSLITLPVFDRGAVVGFIGFDSVKHYKLYTEREIQLLQFLSEIFINAQNRKMFENNLIESRKRFQSIYNNASLGLYRIDMKGTILMVNLALAEILGYDNPGELEGRHVAEMNIVDQSVLAVIQQKLSKNDLLAGNEGFWRNKNGEPIYIRESVRVTRDENGNPAYYDGAAEDITLRKKAENALVESEAKFRQLAENISDMIWLRDLINDEVIYYNPSLARFLGRPQESENCRITCFLDQCKEEDRDRLSEYLTCEVTHEKHGDFVLLDVNNDPKWFRIDVYPVKDITGEVVRQVGIATDITSMIEAQEALRRSLEMEKKVGELKTRFVSMASHEFKTPLASIMMASETIQNFRSRFTDQDYDKYLERIKRNTTHLSSMINNVLNLSKMESGNMQITPERIAINEFIGKWFSGYQSNHPINHDIILELTENELYINVDRQHLVHVMDNLFSNGMKYSPTNSKIEIGTRAQSGNFTISVRDHGIGIPEKDRSTMFSPFFRASNSGSVHGTGLGLSLVKQMVEQNGGRIWFDSVEGEGTVFYVEFPITNPE